MRILITGASGFLGKRLSIALLEKYGNNENSFIFITRNRSIEFIEPYKNNTSIEIVSGDITRPDSIGKFFIGVDYVFHLAAYLAYGNIDENIFYEINVKGSKNIFQLSLENRVKKVIYLSSAGIYHPTFHEYATEETSLEEKHITKYTRSKYLAHLKSSEYSTLGLPIINILPVSIFGESSPLFEPLVKQVKRRLVILPKMSAKLSLVYVGDAVDGILKAFQHGDIGDSYILSGKSLSIKEIVAEIAKILNKKIIILELPKIFFLLALRLLDATSKFFNMNFYYNTELFNYTSGGLVAKDDKAKSKLGFRDTNFKSNFIKSVNSYK